MTPQYGLSGATAREIAASVESAVRSGRLGGGRPLPTVRGLADSLDVSPGTVAAAYRSLRDRGLVVTDGRRGTRVTQRPPVAVSTSRSPVGAPAGAVDLATGNPDPALLPDVRGVLGRRSVPARLYGAPPVLPALATVGRRLCEADGIDAEHLTVVGGALDGLERVLVSALRPGDVVVVEDPGYSGVLDLVAALGLAPRPVPVDDEGLCPDELSQALRGAEAVVLTPRAQNPTGAALTERRVRQLARVVRGWPGGLVVEDDHAGPVAGARCRSVVGDGRRERWAVLRSTAKALGPDLRCAFVVGDPETIGRVEGRMALGPGWVSTVLQQAVADLLTDRSTAGRLRRAEAAYTQRRTALIAALGGHGRVAHGASGLNVWVPVDDEAAVVSALARANWAVSPGVRFRLSSPPGIRVTTAALDPRQAPTLAEAITTAATAPRQAPSRTG